MSLRYMFDNSDSISLVDPSIGTYFEALYHNDIYLNIILFVIDLVKLIIRIYTPLIEASIPISI